MKWLDWVKLLMLLQDNADQQFPITHEVTLEHGSRVVSCLHSRLLHVTVASSLFSLYQVSALALDPAGARLVTGSYDFEVSE